MNPLKRLFVYGIFLGQAQREAFGMTDPEYATVRGYATFGSTIVTAYKCEPPACLTGLVVTVDPNEWEALDKLEYGYERITITTTDGEAAWMYAGKE